MKEKIWFEMYQAKFMSKYFSLLIAKRRKIYDILHITSFIIATAGVILFRFDANFTWAAISMVVVLLAASYVLPAFIPSPEMLLKIENTVAFYSKLFIELEKLWHKFGKNEISENDLSESLFEVMNKVAEQEKVIDSFLKTNKESIWQQSKADTDTYFHSVFKISV